MSVQSLLSHILRELQHYMVQPQRQVLGLVTS
jgi:hypothetical protein